MLQLRSFCHLSAIVRSWSWNLRWTKQKNARHNTRLEATAYFLRCRMSISRNHRVKIWLEEMLIAKNSVTGDLKMFLFHNVNPLLSQSQLPGKHVKRQVTATFSAIFAVQSATMIVSGHIETNLKSRNESWGKRTNRRELGRKKESTKCEVLGVSI